MIPLKLSIQGLYSYKEKQTIDFESLTESRLFGIFGAVGSGKSSILEAIMFILYDKSERLNKSGDNRYYNMLNLQSEVLEIDFIFRAGTNNAHQYRFIFSAKRKKNDFEKVEVKERNFYKREAQDWVPLEGIADASSLTGMNADHFMQTVIIPQGKFREFIDQKPAVRTQMLKDLFHLEKYDLSPKTNALIKDTDLKLSKIEGQLQELGIVTKEDIEAITLELEQTISMIQNQSLQLEKLIAEEKSLNANKELLEAIQHTEAQSQKLQEAKPSYEKREKELKTYTQAVTFFKEKLHALQDYHTEVKEKERLIQSLQNTLSTLEKQKNQKEEKYHKAKEDYSKRDELKEKFEDLNHILDLARNRKQLEQIVLKHTKENEEHQKLDQVFIQEKEKVKLTETKLENLDQQTGNLTEVQAIIQWHNRQRELSEELNRLSAVLNEQKQRKEKISENLLQCLIPNNIQVIEASFPMVFKTIGELEKEKNQALEGLQTQWQELLIKQKLADFSHQLKDGEPCPLCGSAHHPSISKFESLNSHIEAIERQVSSIKKELDKLKLLYQQLQKLEAEHQSISTLTQTYESSYNTAKERLSTHSQSFQDEAYKAFSFEQLLEKQADLVKHQNQNKLLKQELYQLRQNLDNIEKQLKLKEASLKQQENQKLILETQIQNNLKQIKHLDPDKFIKFTEDQLRENLEKGRKKIEETETAFHTADEDLKAVQQILGNTKASLESENNFFQRLQSKTKAIEQELEMLCQEKGFPTLEEVKNTLAQKLNIDAEQKAIEDYKQQAYSLKEKLRQMYKEAEGKSYDGVKHQATLLEIQEFTQSVENLKKHHAVKLKEKENLEKNLENRKGLLKEQDKLRIRKENLQELARLFKGSGFVNFVSTIYLQNLCKAANQRFMKLTKNNLSLELNEENDFIVRDFLNNGKTRLLKTLSGGQTFQAALCLALALAENIKSLNQADQSFFFLDEGFGSLDKDALRIVFETLKSLQKENRIVGIISHVEELQQEINVFLKVENDKERGSLITYSWN
jgi:DNA repair protein SbcC/Rad50